MQYCNKFNKDFKSDPHQKILKKNLKRNSHRERTVLQRPREECISRRKWPTGSNIGERLNRMRTKDYPLGVTAASKYYIFTTSPHHQ